MTALSKSEYVVGQEFRDSVSTQDYSPKTPIQGVQIVDLRLFIDDGGSFNELVRLNPDGAVEALPWFQVRQSSYSEMMPGAIKAWHFHRAQDDLWFVPPSQRLLVGLLDIREGSSTYRRSMRVVLGGGAAKLLYIPAGVAHGAANVWPSAASILYFVSSQFDPADPDELRLPWDCIGSDFWQVQQG